MYKRLAADLFNDCRHAAFLYRSQGYEAWPAGPLHVKLHRVAGLGELGPVVEHEDGLVGVGERHAGRLSS